MFGGKEHAGRSLGAQLARQVVPPQVLILVIAKTAIARLSIVAARLHLRRQALRDDVFGAHRHAE